MGCFTPKKVSELYTVRWINYNDTVSQGFTDTYANDIMVLNYGYTNPEEFRYKTGYLDPVLQPIPNGTSWVDADFSVVITDLNVFFSSQGYGSPWTGWRIVQKEYGAALARWEQGDYHIVFEADSDISAQKFQLIGQNFDFYLADGSTKNIIMVGGGAPAAPTGGYEVPVHTAWVPLGFYDSDFSEMTFSFSAENPFPPALIQAELRSMVYQGVKVPPEFVFEGSYWFDYDAPAYPKYILAAVLNY